jgi:hypothetical protein
MSLRRIVERPGQQLPVDVRLVRLDLGEQLVDEILVSFEYCHDLIVPPWFGLPPPFERTCSGGDQVVPMNVRSPYVHASETDEEADAGRPLDARARRGRAEDVYAAAARTGLASSNSLNA